MNNIRIWSFDDEIRSTEEHIKQLEDSIKERQALGQEGAQLPLTSVGTLNQMIDSLRSHLKFVKKLKEDALKNRSQKSP